MAEDEREVLSLEPIADEPEVGRWLSAMEDARRDTVQALEGLPDEAVDWRPGGSPNTIGTLLYHVALVEADWLLEDILEGAHPWPDNLFPFDARDDEGLLMAVEGTTLRDHLDRLAAIRSLLLDLLRPMTGDDFHTLRRRERFDATPAWVLHHLLQHEAEHRAQIAALKEGWAGA